MSFDRESTLGTAASAPAAGRSSDAELVEAARASDLTAFELLVDRHQAPLLSYLARQTGDPELAADLAQETLLAAFRRLDQLDRLDRPDAFAAWLFRIAHNEARMEWRRRRLKRFISLQWLSEAVADAVPALQDLDGVSCCEERDAIQRVLDDLSPNLREALLLHTVAGFTSPEVARILGISLSAAERRLSRAKTQFRHVYLARNEGTVDAPV